MSKFSWGGFRHLFWGEKRTVRGSIEHAKEILDFVKSPQDSVVLKNIRELGDLNEMAKLYDVQGGKFNAGYFRLFEGIERKSRWLKSDMKWLRKKAPEAYSEVEQELKIDGEALANISSTFRQFLNIHRARLFLEAAEALQKNVDIDPNVDASPLPGDNRNYGRILVEKLQSESMEAWKKTGIKIRPSDDLGWNVGKYTGVPRTEMAKIMGAELEKIRAAINELGKTPPRPENRPGQHHRRDAAHTPEPGKAA